MKRSELYFGILRVGADFLAALLALSLAKAARLNTDFLPAIQEPATFAPDPQSYWYFSLAAATALVVVFAFNGLYHFRQRGPLAELHQILFAVAAWLLCVVGYFFLIREFFFSRLILVYAGSLLVPLVVLLRGGLRLMQNYLASRGLGVRRVLVVGTGTLAAEIATTLRQQPTQKVIGLLGRPNKKSLGKLRWLGNVTDFERICRQYQIDDLVLADPDLPVEDVRALLAHCRIAGIGFRFVPALAALSTANLEIYPLCGVPMVTLLPTPLTGWGRIVKRGFDLITGSLALVATSPIWLLTALAIRLDSPGPVFFTRKDDGTPVLRVGRQGELFPFVKFRSMRVNSDSERYRLRSHRAGPLVKVTNDPRVTRVGRFIRRYSIDELPQLLSVLRGDMSLVGPRPHLPEEVARYQPHERRVLSIKPGITGLPQVSGRSDLEFAREVELDTWYIENWSLWLDLKILLKTIGVVLFPKHKE